MGKLCGLLWRSRNGFRSQCQHLVEQLFPSEVLTGTSLPAFSHHYTPGCAKHVKHCLVTVQLGMALVINSLHVALNWRLVTSLFACDNFSSFFLWCRCASQSLHLDTAMCSCEWLQIRNLSTVLLVNGNIGSVIILSIKKFRFSWWQYHTKWQKLSNILRAAAAKMLTTELL